MPNRNRYASEAEFLDALRDYFVAHIGMDEVNQAMAFKEQLGLKTPESPKLWRDYVAAVKYELAMSMIEARQAAGFVPEKLAQSKPRR